MQALTPDDLLPLEEFASRRREFLTAHGRYLDRYRRVPVGPRLTLLFENRQTLWFRVQEVLRVARLTDMAWVKRELDLYNRLLPGRDRLQAALLLHVENQNRLTEELTPWNDLQGDQVALYIGRARYPANLFTCRPEDRCLGTAFWVQFVLDAKGRERLADFDRTAFFGVRRPGYTHDSGPLGEEVRQSLLEDLALSDRDA
jgi:hypothetical protein